MQSSALASSLVFPAPTPNPFPIEGGSPALADLRSAIMSAVRNRRIDLSDATKIANAFAQVVQSYQQGKEGTTRAVVDQAFKMVDLLVKNIKAPEQNSSSKPSSRASDHRSIFIAMKALLILQAILQRYESLRPLPHCRDV